MDQQNIVILKAFYAQYNPTNAENIVEISKRFAGREAILMSKLEKKYGSFPELTVTQNSSTLITKTPVHYQLNNQLVQPRGLAAGSDEALDIYSSKFDPQKALALSNTLSYLSKEVKPLDNLNRCRHLLPRNDPDFIERRATTVALAKEKEKENQGSSSTSKIPTTTTPATVQKPVPVTVLDRMTGKYSQGPMSVLRSCFLEGARIQVVIRRVNSVRGTCVGWLKAFDKHMNVCLLDVEESLIPLALDRIAQGKSQDRRKDAPSAIFPTAWTQTRVLEKRYHRQLLIRGDNIVMLFRAPQPTSSSGHETSATRASSSHDSNRSTTERHTSSRHPHTSSRRY